MLLREARLLCLLLTLSARAETLRLSVSVADPFLGSWGSALLECEVSIEGKGSRLPGPSAAVIWESVLHTARELVSRTFLRGGRLKERRTRRSGYKARRRRA